MAGLTREARVAGERLPDRISIGVLARTFTDELVDEVIDAADVREVRYRRLPARLVVLFVLSCWLFMRSGYGLVLSRMADALAMGGAGWGAWQLPTTSSITKAKARLGPEPLRLLFDRVKGPQGTPVTPGVFWRGLRIVTMDGFTLDVPDSPANAAFFGRGGNGTGTPNPYPQLRAVVLAEGGTRALLGAVPGPYRGGERSLAAGLLAALGPGMVCLADRSFSSYALWQKAAASGAALLWRMSASFTLPVLETLDDGTWISELKPARKRDGPPIRARIIEDPVWIITETGEQMSELFCLATTLLNPDQAPATELAMLYHDRWQAETGIGELKTTARGGAEVILRSQDPSLVEQEFWAMLCVYHAIRDLMAQAANRPDYAPPGSASSTPPRPPAAGRARRTHRQPPHRAGPTTPRATTPS